MPTINKRLFLYLILIIISSAFFILRGATAFTWVVDMGTFFERISDKNYLVNDFFTNTHNDLNPRHIYGYIIVGLQKIFNSDWYTVIYILQVLIVIVLPILFFIALTEICKVYLKHNDLFIYVIFLFVAISIYPRVSGLFSIALWRSYYDILIPQTLSIAVGLLAIIF